MKKSQIKMAMSQRANNRKDKPITLPGGKEYLKYKGVRKKQD